MNPSNSEKKYLTVLFLVYGFGYFFINLYPFYHYDLFVDAPTSFPVFLFSTSKGPVNHEEVHFVDYNDFGPPTKVGRKARTYYIYGKDFQRQDFSELVHEFFQDHPMVNDLTIEKIDMGTKVDGTFGFKGSVVWQFQR